MLQTLLKIGEWQSHGKSEWDRFGNTIEPPPRVELGTWNLVSPALSN